MTDSQPIFRRLYIDDYRAQFQPGSHVLLDVREPEEWMMGRIPGAQHIPLNDLPDRLSEIPTGKPVVVVCASGIRSLYGGQFLIENGFGEVYNLEDGTKGWVKKGYPIER